MDGYTKPFTRRRFLWLTGAMGALASLESLVPGYALQAGDTSMPSVLSDSKDAFDIVSRKTPFKVGERVGTAVSMNGSVPGPLLRMREGETVTIRVTNRLEEDALNSQTKCNTFCIRCCDGTKI